MGFLDKLGNVVEDTASFALPAGLSLAANAFLPGAGGITSQALFSALGAGAKGFAGNEQQERLRRAQLEQGKNQDITNLINALNPRGRARPAQASIPSPGFLETIASGAGQGIDAFQQAQDVNARRQALTTQQEAADLALGRQKAQTFAQSIGPTPEGGVIVPPLPGQGFSPEQGAAAQSRVTERASGIAADEAFRQTQLDQGQQRIDVQRESIEARTQLAKIQRRAREDAEDFSRAQNRDEFRTETISSLGKENGIKRLQEFRKDSSALRGLIEDMKKSGVRDVSGIEQISAINLFQRTIDPATVREGDVALIRNNAQGFFDKLSQDLTRIVENKGAVVSDRLILDMEKALDSMDRGYSSNATKVITAHFSGLREGGLETIGSDLIDQTEDNAFTKFRLDRTPQESTPSELAANLQRFALPGDVDIPTVDVPAPVPRRGRVRGGPGTTGGGGPTILEALGLQGQSFGGQRGPNRTR